MPRMQIHFAVVVLSLASLLLLTGCTKEKNLAPVSGNGGELKLTNVMHNSVTVSWERAHDDNTSSDYLDYLVVYSKSNNIGDLDSAISNGKKAPVYVEEPDSETPKEIYWNKNIDSIKIKDLEDGQVYYFNVIARDTQWLMTPYKMASEKTKDITAPVPGNAGLVQAAEEKIDDGGTVSLKLVWEEATDNNSSGSAVLKYRVVYSTDDITSVQNALKNDQTPYKVGTLEEDKWRLFVNRGDINVITGLQKGGDYNFNVLVKDEAGNKSSYAGTSQKPEAGNNGELFITNEANNSLTLNWNRAVDGQNDQSKIEYRVMRFEEETIWEKFEDAEAKDLTPAEDRIWRKAKVSNNSSDLIGLDIDGDVLSLGVTGLEYAKKYFFNVVAKDVTGYMVFYKNISNAPKAGGGISIEDPEPTKLTLSWPKATDSGSPSESLSYWVVLSESNNIDTLENMKANGIPIQGWTENLDKAEVTGLMPDGTYFFNVAVRDKTGHETAYINVMSTPHSREPKETSASLPTGKSFAAFKSSGSSTPGGTGKSSVLAQVDGNLPASIDNGNGRLIAWFDAADLSGNSETYDSAVAQWQDKSGQGNHAEQAWAIRRPGIATPAADETPSLCFKADQESHLLVSLGADILLMENDSACTIFLAANNLSDMMDTGAFLFDGQDETGNNAGLMYQTAGGITTFAVRTDHVLPLKTAVSESHFIAMLTMGRDRENRAYCKLTINGCPDTLMNFISLPKAFTRLIIGDSWGGEPNQIGSAFMTGNLNELIIYDRGLSVEEQGLIQDYLQKKWGSRK